ITITGKNKWFVFIGCEEDPDFPGEDISSVNEYLKENGNMGSDTLDFEEHSMTIEGSISDG
ncbi:538_t:CDS:1, partial [Rhizophagus irregularis]